MPEHREVIRYYADGCKPHLQACFDECKSDDANACYGLALAIQELETDRAISEALFLRSCKLGIPSGCTNRAAGMTWPEVETPAAVTCAVRTFDKTCGKDDAWGCTMYGFHLVRGDGVPRDLDHAGRLAQKACRIAPKHDACKYARVIARMIEDAGGTKPDLP